MAPSDPSLTATLKAAPGGTVEFPDNRLLIDLCGPYDANLSQIEKALGVQIVRRALEAPMRQIAANAGEEGSVVVDEVQDLTPMQLKMAARRSLNGAMTIVGDLAQATGPLAPRNAAAPHRRCPVQTTAAAPSSRSCAASTSRGVP